MPTERPNAVTLAGNPLTLVGDEIQVGQTAPDFTVLSREVSPVTLASSAGRTRIFVSVGSLDTDVCDAEVKTFSERAAELTNTEVLVISVDLPFAQSRWCGSEGVDNITFLSDHRETSFGIAYGVLVKESRLLSRGVFVVNAANEVTYVEYVRDILDQPNFDAALEAAKATEVAAT